MNARHSMARTACLMAPLVALLLAGCGPSQKQLAEQQADVQQQAKDAAANAQARNYVQARDAGQYELAQNYAKQLLHDAPDSVAAREVKTTLDDTNVKADEARDKRRLAALWTYNTELLDGGGDNNVVYSASIYATPDPNFNGDQVPVRLVLRRHPKWGRSAYLVLDHGQFDCPPGCKLSVQFDDKPPQMMASTKSDQNKQAMFIDDEATVREALDKIRAITVQTSVDGQPRTLTFDVGGFDRAQLERKMP
ncbi:MAG: hypothetical protein JSS44_09985 [Proteobacteria bacterium]|nr:hypothetical protein [Pseudomonadota bacterium]MBS0464397.1 hypothetical protein [Pseudomonadota bacterium]